MGAHDFFVGNYTVIQNQRKLFAFLLALLGLILVIFWIKNLLISFLLAFVFVFLMNPIIEKVERKKVPRIWSTIFIFTLTTVVGFLLMSILFPTMSQQFQKLQTEWPNYLKTSDVALNSIMGFLDDYLSLESVHDLLAQVKSGAAAGAQKVFADIPNYISNSLTVLFLTPFLTFFMLLDGPQFLRKILNLAPPAQSELVHKIMDEVALQIGGFIRARFFETLLVGVVIWIGLMILGFPYALLLSVFAAILNIIPYLGPLIGIAPAFLIALSLGDTASVYIWIAVIYGLAQIIDMALLVPILVAKIVNLHPVIVVLSVMLGAELMGILGMIISIPVTSALKVIIESLYAELIEKDSINS